MSTVAGTLRAAVSRTSNQAIGRATVFGLVGVSGLAVNSALLWFLAEPARRADIPSGAMPSADQ